MKVNVNKVFVSLEALDELLKERMPIQASLKLRKVSKALRAEADPIIIERTKIFSEFGITVNMNNTEDGKQMQVPDIAAFVKKEPKKRVNEFNARFNELMDADVEIDVKPMKHTDFGENFSPPGGIIVVLEDFITE